MFVEGLNGNKRRGKEGEKLDGRPNKEREDDQVHDQRHGKTPDMKILDTNDRIVEYKELARCQKFDQNKK